MIEKKGHLSMFSMTTITFSAIGLWWFSLSHLKRLWELGVRVVLKVIWVVTCRWKVKIKKNVLQISGNARYLCEKQCVVDLRLLLYLRQRGPFVVGYISAVHQLFIFHFASQHCLRSTFIAYFYMHLSFSLFENIYNLSLHVTPYMHVGWTLKFTVLNLCKLIENVPNFRRAQGESYFQSVK